MTENELQKGDSETEILSADDEKLRRMCKGLKKINAPKNFDFHLKARIANANAEDFQTASLVPFLRYLLPFSVVVLLAAFVGFNLLMTSKNETQIAQSTVAPQQIQQNPVVSPTASAISSSPANFSSSPANFIAAEDKLTAAANIGKKISNADSPQNSGIKKDTQPKSKDSDNEIFSRESASRSGKVITANGIQNPDNANSAKSADSIKQLFNFIGITAVFESAKWKVTSVDANNMAGRAGVKVGDLIEAIDGNKLGGSSAISGTVNVKTIEVVRNGKNISLELNK